MVWQALQPGYTYITAPSSLLVSHPPKTYFSAVLNMAFKQDTLIHLQSTTQCHVKEPSIAPIHTWIIVALICCLAVHHLGTITSPGLLHMHISPSFPDTICTLRATHNGTHEPSRSYITP